METNLASARRKAEIRKFYRHLCTYIVVMLFMTFINYVRTPHHWWVIWPAAGWALGIMLQALYIIFPQDDHED